MIAFFGCARYCPRALSDAIAPKLRKLDKRIGVLMPGQKTLPETDVIFAWGAKVCVDNAPKLSKSRAALIVFDCTERLSELANVTLLDDSPHTTKACTQAILAALATPPAKRIRFQHSPVDAIRPILEAKKTNGFLNRYNTLLYAISNKDAREKLRQFIFATMGGAMPANLFNSKAAELVPKRGKGRDAALGLIELVNSADAEKLRKALQAVLKSKLPPDKAVEPAIKEFGVVSFDLRYLLASVQKQQKAKDLEKVKANERGGGNGKKPKAGRPAPA